MIVTLSETEVRLAEMLGLERSRCARRHAVPDKKMGNQPGCEIDILGCKAEFAFAKAFNVCPDLSTSPRSGGEDFTYKGFTVDVKATHYPNGRLLIHKKKSLNDSQLYVLAIVTGDEVNLVGYMPAAEALQPKYLRDLGHGEGYAIEQHELYKFKEDVKACA